jgi:formylglycine-generating enzyme required for sulfatase activity
MVGSKALAWARWALGVLVTSAAGCQPSVAPRAQLLVIVDTDAHVVDELASRPDVSGDAAIDSLRIDLLDPSDHAYDTRLFSTPEMSSYPISFGVYPQSGSTTEVHLRIRAFRSTFATAGIADNGAATLDPMKEVTIDRLAWIPFPSTGVASVRVVLREDCLGTFPSFTTHTTCIDAAHTAGAPREGIDVLSAPPPPTLAGTWPTAVEQPCTVPSSEEKLCIRGGFSIVGDPSGQGVDPGLTIVDINPVPLRPVVLRPFLLDKTEFTVGRFRTLALAGALPAGTDMPCGTDCYPYCTWLGAADGSNDKKPLNCVSYDTAVATCGALGGTLPTEAQWEHAARGRGQQLRYPWGNDEPKCCTLSASRGAPLETDAAPECDGSGIEPVGSHVPSDASDCLGDLSRDGVLDMAGSVAEALRGGLWAYTDPCWGSDHGIVRDPDCGSTDAGPKAQRGANWSSSLAEAWLVTRHEWSIPDEFAGFRCAYAGISP